MKNPLLGTVVLTLLIGLGGCAQPPAPPVTTVGDATANQIKAIENNTNMPPDVKASTLARLKQQQQKVADAMKQQSMARK